MDVTYLENNLIYGGAAQSYVFYVIEYLQDHGHLEEHAHKLKIWLNLKKPYSLTNYSMPMVGRFLQHMFELAGQWANFLLGRLLDDREPKLITELYRSTYLIYLLAARGPLMTVCSLEPICESAAHAIMLVVESIVDYGCCVLGQGSLEQLNWK